MISYEEEAEGLCPYSGKNEIILLNITETPSEDGSMPIRKKAGYTCPCAKLFHCRSGNSCPVYMKA